MSYLRFQSEYDRFPQHSVSGFDEEAWRGWEKITQAIRERTREQKTLIADCYPGVNDDEILPMLQEAFQPETTILTEDLFYDSDTLTEMMKPNLTDDRVRGIMYFGRVQDFIDPQKLKTARDEAAAGRRVLIYGFAASLVSDCGATLYLDLTRWEIQLRYRRGMPNYKQHNDHEDSLRKIKRGFFIEWRIADRHKIRCFDRIDLYLDTNVQNAPKMITGDALRAGLCSLTSRPFRLVPYFDPGVWGGQWMKEVCHLDPEEKNYAWSFDGVPEENSLMLKYGDVVLETPAMNLTLYQPKQFLGEKTFARFGAEFPIRFDFLDTMGGQNLSLQVHPLTDYMYRKFGMPYTQDESYYILDCAEGEGGVYLGFKEGVDPTEFIADLRSANRGEQSLDAEKYVNRWPAKKHDHFLIPAGTIHCSSANCMVLEISATPYIFTFKLWDWDRLGLDGIPRPIHIDDGQEVLQYDRTTGWVKENLINRFRVLEENERYTETKTGLHELEFIETHVFDVREEAPLPFDGEFAMCNLVEGKAAVLESRDGLFAPYEVHYAETFILPARAGRVMIRPRDPEEPVRVIVAKIRYGC